MREEVLERPRHEALARGLAVHAERAYFGPSRHSYEARFVSFDRSSSRWNIGTVRYGSL
jgi:hypothetical protein